MNNLISFWNDLSIGIDKMPIHHDTNTHVYKLTKQYLIQLKRGRFGQCHDLEGFINEYPELEYLINKKWSDSEIRYALKQCSKL